MARSTNGHGMVWLLFAIMALGGCTTATVHRRSGVVLRGRLMHKTSEAITIRTKVVDKVPVEEPDGTVRWEELAETRTLTIPRSDVALFQSKNDIALGFAIAGTIVAGAGLIGLGPAIVSSQNCTGSGWSCLDEAVGVVAAAGVAISGGLMAFPAWLLWGGANDNEVGTPGPRVQLGLGSVSGTF